MSDDYSRLFNLVSLALSLVGALILFRWRMPFRVPTGGAIEIIAEPSDPKEIALEHIYAICGYVGLSMLILGTVLQMVAVLMPAKKAFVMTRRGRRHAVRCVARRDGGDELSPATDGTRAPPSGGAFFLYAPRTCN